MNLEKTTREASWLALQAGAFIREHSHKVREIEVEEKERNSLVSYVDKTAERMLVDGLSKLIPGCGQITEEDTKDIKDREWTWIIDPLDGTTNFLWGVPVFSVSVGLMHHDKMVMGIVYEVNRDELFVAHQGGKAYRNNRVITVSNRQGLKNGLLATGFPYIDYSGIQAYMGTLQHLMEHSRGVRRLGSAAVDLAYVACGRYEGFFEYGLNPWDVAAGIVIIQQAGGKITDFSGGDNYLFGKEIIATNNHIHDELHRVLSNKFEK